MDPGERSRCTLLKDVRDVRPRTPNGCEECFYAMAARGFTCGCASAAVTSAAAITRRTSMPQTFFARRTIRWSSRLNQNEDWRWCYVDGIALEPAPVQKANDDETSRF